MELKFILEALLFAAQKPLSLKELRDVFAAAVEHAEGDETVRGFRKVKESELENALQQLAVEHEQAGRSYRLACVAGSWQFVSQPEYAPWLKALVGHKARPPRLSQPALETLAIIAYKQPIIRADIEAIRGVAAGEMIRSLMYKGLVKIVGRAEILGRPMLYGTTKKFLEVFGLNALKDLPKIEELKKPGYKEFNQQADGHEPHGLQPAPGGPGQTADGVFQEVIAGDRQPHREVGDDQDSRTDNTS